MKQSTLHSAGSRLERQSIPDPRRRPWEQDLVMLVEDLAGSGKALLEVGAPGSGIFFLNSPELAREVLVTRHRLFLNNPFPFSKFGDSFQPTGKTLLKIPTNEAPEVVEASIENALRRTAQRFHEDFEAGVANDRTVECVSLTKRHILSLTRHLLWGESLEFDHLELAEAFELLERYSTYRPLGPVNLTEADRAELQKAADLKFAHARELIERHWQGYAIERATESPPFDDNPAPDSYADLCALVTRILVNGFNGPAISLAWILYMVALHPEEQERIAEEVFALTGEAELSYALSARLEHTSRVVMETVRLFPTAWLLGRFTREPTLLGGIELPARASVSLSPYILHRNPEVWPEPLTFRPERFHPDNLSREAFLSYLPFGSGPNKCPASSFAGRQLTFLVASIIQRYRLTPEGPNPLPWGLISLRPVPGIHLRCTRRNPPVSHA